MTIMTSTILDSLTQTLGLNRVAVNKDISAYFTMRTKTIAEYFFEAESRDDVINAVSISHTLGIPLLFIGGGSNIAVIHTKIPGLVVRNIYQKKQIVKEDDRFIHLFISSGYPMSRLAMECAKAGYEGFEYHLGLPGTLGGGVALNSKWAAPMGNPGVFPKYIGDHLVRAWLVKTDGTVYEVARDYFQFAYDYSVLKDTHEIFLEGEFQFQKADPAVLMKRANDAMEYRKKTQVMGSLTCGCMFQNISEKEKLEKKLPTVSAGYLIDQCGLKNFSIGDYVVSEKHANFIVNRGAGSAQDLMQLMDTIKSRVQEKFGIELIEEVVLV